MYILWRLIQLIKANIVCVQYYWFALTGRVSLFWFHALRWNCFHFLLQRVGDISCTECITYVNTLFRKRVVDSVWEVFNSRPWALWEWGLSANLSYEMHQRYWEWKIFLKLLLKLYFSLGLCICTAATFRELLLSEVETSQAQSLLLFVSIFSSLLISVVSKPSSGKLCSCRFQFQTAKKWFFRSRTGDHCPMCFNVQLQQPEAKMPSKIPN